MNKNRRLVSALAIVFVLTFTERMSAHIIGVDGQTAPSWFTASSNTPAVSPKFYTAPSGNGALMASSFTPFKPKVRCYWDNTYFYEESDGIPDRTLAPNLMVGITSWQQHFPVFTSYFGGTTNPESDSFSLGYHQPNIWKLPLVPVPAASPITLTNGNFQRGAVAIAANGVPIFNPRNNTGRFSYAIGELDQYGGHCGKADDYHYHIAPLFLQGILGTNTPVAWALDGYPVYGYTEPDGTARQPLDGDGGHDIGNGWGYHYHAIGSAATGPQAPYLMNNFHGTVANYGGQVDGQPEVGSIRQTNSIGFQDQPVPGASITAFINPVALTNDVSGNFGINSNGVASADQYFMRFGVGGTNYDICWRINRSANPKTMTVTWRMPGYLPYTSNYFSDNNRLTTYPMAAWSELKLPDTGQTITNGATPGQDANYTIYPPSFADNGNGTITDNLTGLMWQKVDNGESTWETAVSNSTYITTGGYTDWRLPTPAELMSILNHNDNKPAMDTTYFPTNPIAAADYWWTSDSYGSDTTNIWCANAGGGLGPKPKTETISAGGTLHYDARYVRGAKPTNGHNYLNNGDGTVSDLDTGLMWTQLPLAATNWYAALTNAANLSLGGYTSWRVPNVKEMETLSDYTLATASSTAGIIPCINRTLFSKSLNNCTPTINNPTVTCADTSGLLVGMPLQAVSVVQVTGCATTAGSPTIICTNTAGLTIGLVISGTGIPNGAHVLSVTTNTSFTISANASSAGTIAVLANFLGTNAVVSSIISGTAFAMSANAINSGTGLTLKALVPPTAYWTSSSLRAGTLSQAWLVEFGINNSVPATNGPTRNKQSIVSYEIYGANYPCFCVRGPDQACVIASPKHTNSAVQINWAAVPGRSYTIYYSTNLSSANLNTNVIGTVYCNGTVGSFVDTNAAHASQTIGFYRASYIP